MTDTEILDWIENELRVVVGTGPFHHVARHVHNGIPLREAVVTQISIPKPDTAKPRRKATPKPPKPYFTPHAYYRFYQRIGVHPSIETQGEIVEMIRTGKGQVIEKMEKGWVVKYRIVYRRLSLYVIYDHRKKQVTTLWTEAEHRAL